VLFISSEEDREPHRGDRCQHRDSKPASCELEDREKRCTDDQGGRDQKDLGASGPSLPEWWAFERFTKVDSALATDRLLLTAPLR
jgi:hypothetical protein